MMGHQPLSHATDDTHKPSNNLYHIDKHILCLQVLWLVGKLKWRPTDGDGVEHSML